MEDKSYHFPLIWVQSETVVKNLVINGLHRREYVNPVDTIHIGKNTVVEKLTVNGFSLENHTGKRCRKLLNRGLIKTFCSDSLTSEDIETENECCHTEPPR